MTFRGHKALLSALFLALSRSRRRLPASSRDLPGNPSKEIPGFADLPTGGAGLGGTRDFPEGDGRTGRQGQNPDDRRIHPAGRARGRQGWRRILLSLSLFVILSCNSLSLVTINSVISKALTEANKEIVEEPVVCKEEKVCSSGSLVFYKPDGEGDCVKQTMRCKYGCSSVENGDDTCNPPPPTPTCKTEPYCLNDQLVYEELDTETNTCVEKVLEDCEEYGCDVENASCYSIHITCPEGVHCLEGNLIVFEPDYETITCTEIIVETCAYGCSAPLRIRACTFS